VLDITIRAPENAGIASIAVLKDELLSAIEKAAKGSSIMLDLSGTTHADSSLAQVILAFEATAADKGLRATIKGDDDLSLRSLLSSDSVGRPDGKAKRKPAEAEGDRA
jgi:hypothetical protein